MSIAAGHDQICALVSNEVKKLGSDWAAGLLPHLAHREHAMAAKVGRDVGQMCFGGFRLAFVDAEDQNLVRPLQKRKGIAHGAAALARVLPRHHHPMEVWRSNHGGDDQDRPARAQEDHAGIDKIMHVAASVPCSDDDEIRRSCLAGDKFMRQFKSGAPFNLLEVLAFAAESPAHLI